MSGFAVFVHFVLRPIEDARLSEPQGIQGTSGGSSVFFKFVSLMMLRLSNSNGGLSPMDTIGLAIARIDSGLTAKRPIFVFLPVVLFKTSRAQTPFGFSRARNAKHFVVLVSLPLQNGNVFRI